MADIETIGLIGGVPVLQVTLQSGALRARVITLGARLTGLWVPDRKGALADVVLGFDRVEDWLDKGGYLGATCGRFGNRIAKGHFVLDGQEIQLSQNEGAGHLHGGKTGFDARHWQIEARSESQVVFALTSPAGDMGYPGTLRARATYSLEGLTLGILMEAATDAPTVVNLVHHSYFNLAGHASGDILRHRLRIDADGYLPVDGDKIPTGDIRPVAGTAFDFRQPRAIGDGMPDPGGFDHNFCLTAAMDPSGLRPCLEAADPLSGRRMRLQTTEPGVQLYTGGHFDGTLGKTGACYPRIAGFAVETQRFPNAPNTPHFPSARLDPGQRYAHRMRFDFTPSPAEGQPPR
jgi:aldose 1-epimerase